MLNPDTGYAYLRIRDRRLICRHTVLLATIKKFWQGPRRNGDFTIPITCHDEDWLPYTRKVPFIARLSLSITTYRPLRNQQSIQSYDAYTAEMSDAEMDALYQAFTTIQYSEGSSTERDTLLYRL